MQVLAICECGSSDMTICKGWTSCPEDTVGYKEKRCKELWHHPLLGFMCGNKEFIAKTLHDTVTHIGF